MSKYINENTGEYISLAKEFQEHCQKVHEEIKVKVAEAKKALNEAVAIADANGVPFRSSISFLSNIYVPGTFGSSKFAELLQGDEDVDGISMVEEISGCWGEYINELYSSSNGGWLHSAVC